jgi:AraC family transcriptional regulator, glycine betaine-responsive activator
MDRPTHFAFLLLPEFTHLAFSCAIEPLRLANLMAGQALYRWSLMSPDGASAQCSNGAFTLVNAGLTPTRGVDRLFVISGLNVLARATPDVMAFLRRERAAGTPLGAICSGAYVLARAGFLDGVQTALHWDWHDHFAEEFPQVRLVRNVFVADERIVTASGGTAAADLMLHLIGAAHGIDLATIVADQMVYNAVREGTAPQRVSLQSRHGMRNEHLIRAIAMMEASIEEPRPTAEIAEALEISVRQLERLFDRYLNATPKAYFTEMRLHRARNLLVQSEQSVTEVAIACGFRSSSHFAKCYKRAYGLSPLSQRSRMT